MAQTEQQCGHSERIGRPTSHQLAIWLEIYQDGEQRAIELLNSGEFTSHGIKVHDSGEVHALHDFVAATPCKGVFASTDADADAGDGFASMKVLLGLDSGVVKSLSSKKSVKKGSKLIQFLLSEDPQVLCVLQDCIQEFCELKGKAIQCTFCCKENDKDKTTGQVVIVLQAIGSDDPTELPQSTEAGLTNDDGIVTRENHSGEGADAIRVTDEVELDSGTVGNNQPENKSEGMQQDTQPSGQPTGQSSDNDLERQQLSSILFCITNMMEKVKSGGDTAVLGKLNSECDESDRVVANRRDKLSQEIQKRDALQQALDEQKTIVFNEQTDLEKEETRNDSLKMQRTEEQEKQEARAKRQKCMQQMIDCGQQLQALDVFRHN